MMDINAYNPFPNAILFNWATIFVLGFGNLAALDFQVLAASFSASAEMRCISSNRYHTAEEDRMIRFSATIECRPLGWFPGLFLSVYDLFA